MFVEYISKEGAKVEKIWKYASHRIIILTNQIKLYQFDFIL